VFAVIETSVGSGLLTLEPIFRYLLERGAVMEGEHVIIDGTPVQFLPPTSELAEDAILKAVEHDVDGLPVNVFTAEHLAAVSLETGRAKDKTRLVQFLEEGAVDRAVFESLVIRYGLGSKWAKFQSQFLDE
jgi:hypothetical protein